jgi:hypothetical protein
MGSRLDRWFRPFEGERSAQPLAIFRVAFFGGLLLHFGPALLWLDDGYAPGSLRTEEWSHWLFVHFTRFPHGAVRAAAIATLAACACGVVGLKPRAAAIVAGVGCYAFASFNGLHVQTLAIVNAWAILLAWMICGGGARAWSVESWRARASGPAREPKLLSSLILYQVLLAVFFSGVEKLLAGWPGTNEMRVVLSYPRGFMVRDWVWSLGALHGEGFTRAFTWLTLAVELGTPPLLLMKRTRVAALVVYELFFLGIIAMLEVPPLFYCIFAFGALLALDDDEVARTGARLERAFAFVRRR